MQKILLVDDEANIRDLNAMYLEKEGFTVEHAVNGTDAIARFEQSQPQLVVLDVMMPGMDGFEAMREIRQIAKFRSVPIIAVTAKAMKGDRQKCLEAGASDYINKPVDTEQLLSLLRIWLDR